jgi:hypothetical protein
MTDRPDTPDDDPMAGRLSEMPDAESDPRFREALRAAFIRGEFEARREIVRSPIIRWPWVGLAIAAGLLLLAVGLLNRGPAWRVADATGSEPVRIDGRSFAADEHGRIAGALRAEAHLEVPTGGRLDLEWPDGALFEVTGGTRMTLPDRPGRWFGRAVSCSVFVGEVRLKTGPDFPGRTLRIYTPDGMVVVTGTLLSVECDEGGTCVCVLEGTAMVGVDRERLDPIDPGFRKIMLKDGTVDIIPVKRMHQEGLLDFDRRLGQMMNRAE